MIEAAMAGCYCLVPNELSYPELFPAEQRYNTKAQLVKHLSHGFYSFISRLD